MIHTYQTILTEKLLQIKNDLSAIATYNAQTDDWEAVPDSEDVSESEADSNIGADGVEDWNERRATLATLETEYRNITRALEKITKNNYGYCEICHDHIPEERLLANVTARTCLAHLNDEVDLPL